MAKPKSSFWSAISRPRPRHICLLLAFVFSSGLFLAKSSWVSSFSQHKLEFTRNNNDRIFNLFQASFYFYFEDQFKPGVQEFIKKTPDLKRIMILSTGGQVAFDSNDLSSAEKVADKTSDAVMSNLPQNVFKLQTPQVVDDNNGVGILIPTGQYSIYYTYSLRAVYLKFFTLLAIGNLLLALIWFVTEIMKFSFTNKIQRLFVYKLKVNSLRTKLIATIVLLDLLTGAIIFFSQSQTQKKEQTERLIKNSVAIAELSRDHIITSFSNFFYFYYHDKFVPAVKQDLSSKENLIAIRIISRKSAMVVFDSDDMDSGKQPVPGVEGKKSSISDKVFLELEKRDVYYQVNLNKGSEPFIQVVTAYKNENQESPFLVEYVFSFASLKDRIRTIQRQIIINLIPSLAIGILIAFLFSQLIVRPVQRLLTATQAIAGGNYDVSLESEKKDELGDLVRSFNVMAGELKRKNELRKYLSDQSYRRITEAPEGVLNPSGSRVRATVLFSDIRNFVNVCELLDAEEVTSLLNEYFSSMVEVIYKHKGEVDKFIGDAILTVFYEQDNLKQPVNTALHAIYCAMEMRERLSEFNAKRLKLGKPTIDIGIGINSGEIISGPIGSPDRMDFTVIGDVVNVANRIEKLSKQGRHTRIVFSNNVETRVRGLLDYEELSRDKIRGKEEDVVVYELIKIKDVEELLANLSHPDPNIKRHCIELLGYSRNHEAIVPLTAKLSDSNDGVRVSAIVSISRLARPNDETVEEILFKQLENENSERVISTLLISLGKLCHSRKLMRIAGFLQHPDERIVANAIEALGGSEDLQIIDLLIPFVTSKSNRVKANAAMVLFSKGRVEVLDTLKPMLLHSDPTMRASAAFALGELTLLASADQLAGKFRGDTAHAKHFLGELQSCVPLLVSLLKDKQPNVKRQAIVALGKIKDKTAVLPLLDNLNLEHDSKEIMHDVAEALRSIGSHRLVREMVKQLS